MQGLQRTGNWSPSPPSVSLPTPAPGGSGFSPGSAGSSFPPNPLASRTRVMSQVRTMCLAPSGKPERESPALPLEGGLGSSGFFPAPVRALQLAPDEHSKAKEPEGTETPPSREPALIRITDLGSFSAWHRWEHSAMKSTLDQAGRINELWQVLRTTGCQLSKYF